MRRFRQGETAVRRDLFRDRVWSAHALRVVADGPEALVLGCWPGTQMFAPTTWIDWLQTGDETARSRAIPQLACGHWQLGSWSWRSTAHLQWVPPEAWFSVHAFYEPTDGHRLTHWYVNFQQPMRRTAIGFDTFDLLLDLVIEPDLSRWTWKDEDEYAHGRRLGVVSEADHRAVQMAREEATAMIVEGTGPFASDAGWRNWRSEPHWPSPSLPTDTLTLGLPRPSGSG
ncbi:DUF402 domain-containing protein [Streptomyces coacervatus]|uniref:DUF402 domain-containing protein n=1 Tax=Streptomyces coacervatus TaxID=647381 RepID=A0ABP7GR37_9ACTN|nr:DUF402 domain-containing protein [Streptomyces coacervatus]MDF2264953.1 DUF402 domain-containing protein [Streptomyces coacervatus]